MTPGANGGYRRLGPEVGFGEAELDAEHIMPIRLGALGEFLDVSSSERRRNFDDPVDIVAGALIFGSLGEGEYETPNRSVVARVKNDYDTDYWRLTAGVGSYLPSQPRRKHQTYYSIEMLGDQVLDARRTVKVVTGMPLGEDENVLTMNDEGLKRLMFEKPMTAEDCEHLSQDLERAAKRADVRLKDRRGSGWRLGEI